MIDGWNNFSLGRRKDQDDDDIQYDWVIEFQCKDKEVLNLAD
jgi:hypothetical protein